jgi:hypothetical protein
MTRTYYSHYDEEGHLHTVLDKARLAALPRRLGRMRDVAEVAALADATRQQIDAHRAAVDAGHYCPHCETATWEKTAHEQCPEWQRLDAAVHAQQVILSAEGLALLEQRDTHRRDCALCQTVLESRIYLANCPQAEQWNEEWHLYKHRAAYLENKAERGTCAEPGCSAGVWPSIELLDIPPGAESRLCYTHLRKHGLMHFKQD